MIYYTYELVDPRTNLIFYVGKGKNNRMHQHFKKVKNNKTLINKHLENKLKQLIDEKLEPIYNKTFESENEQECFQKEISRIKEIGIDNLCNMTHGGEGGLLSIEAIHKLSISKMCPRFNYILECLKCKNKYTLCLTLNEFNRGWYKKHCSKKCAYSRIKSALEKLKISNIMIVRGTSKGKNNSRYGKNLYNTWVEKYGKIEADNKMKIYKEKQRNSLTNRKFSNQTIKKMSDAAKTRWKNFNKQKIKVISGSLENIFELPTEFLVT